MRRWLSTVIFLIAVFSFKPHAPQLAFETLLSTNAIAITGATLIDGSGRPPIKDSVVIIQRDLIAAVGPKARIKIPAGARVIDARGLVLAPGFIDTHSHTDGGLETDPAATTQVSQGITTAVVGQDGGSELPVGEFLTKLDSSPVALNVATFVGNATSVKR
jgi:N-acyl-D-amino-acid deacylase